MLGGSRDKWTRIMANFPAIQSLNIRCDRSHEHEPWGFARDADNKRVWATALESQYPTKMCIAVVNVVLQFAAAQGLNLRANTLLEDNNPLNLSRHAMITAGQQPKPSRVPPIVSDFSSVALFLATTLSQVPCSLMSKLDKDVQLHTKAGILETVPKHSRFLRFNQVSSHQRGDEQGKTPNLKRPLEQEQAETVFEVAFGLPWTHEGFMKQACKAGHPAVAEMGIPNELAASIKRNVEWTALQMSSYRLAWCRKWMKRAAELEQAERADACKRHPAVAEITADKRLLLAKEMLLDINYEDVAALDLLSEGATLAGEVERSPAFEPQYKPCLATVAQLEEDAERRNQLVLQMTVSSGSEETDLQLLQETELELERGWAEDPFELHELEFGATVSRRFPLIQSSKTRMIDDFSVSGVNDSCVAHNKVDLHLVDTFCSMVRSFFSQCASGGLDSELRAKTYDLTSAYRQVPVRPSHYKYAYVSVFNCRKNCAEIYRMRAMPFGATHSVYCFLRLAKCLYALAVRGLFLLSTNFYDDFILASQPCLCESSKNSMELLFMLTGWQFARDGKKSTAFSMHCKALGVEFNFSRSEQCLLQVANTESRKAELVKQLDEALKCGKLDKQECLMLRGRLGFADSFLHGRVGKLVLKKLIDHAYGRTSVLSDELRAALQAMSLRLQNAGPKVVSADSFTQWFVYTDASYEPSTKTGGLGGVLVNSDVEVCAWFGIALDAAQCEQLGACDKVTIIYELELLAAVVSLDIWCGCNGDELNVHFGDNDGVQYSLVKASSTGHVGQKLMEFHLKTEAMRGSRTWFARVPTECNLSDFPSRGVPHPLLLESMNVTTKALEAMSQATTFVCNGGEHN